MSCRTHDVKQEHERVEPARMTSRQNAGDAGTQVSPQRGSSFTTRKMQKITRARPNIELEEDSEADIDIVCGRAQRIREGVFHRKSGGVHSISLRWQARLAVLTVDKLFIASKEAYVQHEELSGKHESAGVSKQGYLRKVGAFSRLEKCLVVFSLHHLRFYLNEAALATHEACDAPFAVDADMTVMETSFSNQNGYGFEIVESSGRRVELVVETKEERKAWMKTITSAVDSAQRALLLAPYIVVDHMPLHEIVKVELHREQVEDEIIPNGFQFFKNREKIGGSSGSKELVELTIQTIKDGYNSGRTYVFRVNPDEGEGWLTDLQLHIKQAQVREAKKWIHETYGKSWLYSLRAQALLLHESVTFQMYICGVIFLGFGLDLTEAQLIPVEGSGFYRLLMATDMLFTCLFALEVLLNLFANSDHWFAPFLARKSNIFDAVHVLLSIVALLLIKMESPILKAFPALKMLRLARLLRVIHMFRGVKEINKIITAISCALVPVTNAFLILLTITSIYAIAGTHLYGAMSPHYFGNLASSLFSMFQVMTGDSWASMIARGLFVDSYGEPCNPGVMTQEPCRTKTDVTFFFVSYILLCTIILLNVIIAVLLGLTNPLPCLPHLVFADEFTITVQQEIQAKKQSMLVEAQARTITGVLDPLVQSLTNFEDEADLSARIDGWYRMIDHDDSGGIDFQEFKTGVKRLPGASGIHLTHDEFDQLTEYGRFTSDQGQIQRSDFQLIIKAQLTQLARREIANMLVMTESEEFKSTVMLLRLMERQLGENISDIQSKVQGIYDMLREQAEKSGGPAPSRCCNCQHNKPDDGAASKAQANETESRSAAWLTKQNHDHDEEALNSSWNLRAGFNIDLDGREMRVSPYVDKGQQSIPSQGADHVHQTKKTEDSPALPKAYTPAHDWSQTWGAGASLPLGVSRATIRQITRQPDLVDTLTQDPWHEPQALESVLRDAREGTAQMTQAAVEAAKDAVGGGKAAGGGGDAGVDVPEETPRSAYSRVAVAAAVAEAKRAMGKGRAPAVSSGTDGGGSARSDHGAVSTAAWGSRAAGSLSSRHAPSSPGQIVGLDAIIESKHFSTVDDDTITLLANLLGSEDTSHQRSEIEFRPRSRQNAGTGRRISNNRVSMASDSVLVPRSPRKALALRKRRQQQILLSQNHHPPNTSPGHASAPSLPFSTRAQTSSPPSQTDGPDLMNTQRGDGGDGGRHVFVNGTTTRAENARNLVPKLMLP